MAIFTAFGRRRPVPAEEPGRDLPEDVRHSLPPRFEAVGEALVSATDTGPACAVVGRDVARDGASLHEALDGLRTTYGLVAGTEPDVAAVEALSVAWGEATLEFLHGLSCDDPLTGMASLAHLRSRLDEHYREADLIGRPLSESHCLVVVAMTARDLRRRAEHQFTRALHLVQVAECMRATFPGAHTLTRLSADRAALLTRRGDRLGPATAMLRDLLDELDLGNTRVRVWIEGLPARHESARCLLDELAR